ncbi:hypothetical protein BT69DRAFT_923313 [Atractiella rhizophila]|nr:hypothetical protein BT69DRAFT_923313 [Atractiella rhizophila]
MGCLTLGITGRSVLSARFGKRTFKGNLHSKSKNPPDKLANFRRPRSFFSSDEDFFFPFFFAFVELLPPALTYRFVKSCRTGYPTFTSPSLIRLLRQFLQLVWRGCSISPWISIHASANEDHRRQGLRALWAIYPSNFSPY